MIIMPSLGSHRRKSITEPTRGTQTLYDSNTINSYRCPKCKGELTHGDSLLRCATCSKDWPIDNSIPCFTENRDYWQIIEKSKFQSLIVEAKELGWQHVVKSYLPSVESQHYAYARERADFRVLLPRLSFNRILDLGCGWGTISVPLAENCQQLFALDSTYESLEFLQLRCQQEKILNIHPVLGDALTLPFPDGHFDLIIMNGVFERVGQVMPHSKVVDCQIQAASEVFRCLHPDGCLYIGIENRWGFQYIVGTPDEHTGLRFVTILPRPLANFYSKSLRKREYTVFTHSYRKLKHLLRTAGFGKFSCWCLLPTYRDICYAISLDEYHGYRQGLRYIYGFHARRVPKWLFRSFAGLGNIMFVRRLLAPHFAVIAERNED